MKLGDSPPPAASFELPPQEALDFFRAKGLKPTFAWQDMAAGEHAHAFTIAKMMDVDLLADVRKSLDAALANGTPFEAWKKEIQPLLEAKGWWGKKLVVDPVTGKTVNAQLGSAARLETIFRTNLQSAYAAGHWDQIQAQKDEAPYLMYDAIDDYRTREAHRAWDGTILPVDSEWWRAHYPPNGFACRCSCIQLSDDELDALGLKPSREPPTDTREWENPRTGEKVDVPLGVDPGFGRPPTRAPQKVAADLAQEKIQALPQDLAASANLGVEATQKQIAQEVQQRVMKQVGQAALADAEAAAAAAETAAAIAAAEAEAAALAGAAEAEAAQQLAAKQLAELGKAAPTTLQGKVYQQLAKAGALDGDPVKALETLEAKLVEAKAAHQKATLVGGYKSKAIAGKLPTEAQQAAFAALSASEQEALLVQVQKAQKAAAKLAADALAAEQAAAAALAAEQAAIAEAAALAEAAAAQAAAEAAAAAAKAAEEAAAAVAKAEADAAAQAAASEAAAAAKAAEKKAATKAKKAATKAKKAAAEAELSKAPPPVALTAPTEALDGGAYTQVGPQAGSNPGGLYQDTTTGQRWYVKFPSAPALARNEGLTANLYELAGVEAPEYRFIDMPDGRRGIASKWIDGLEKNKAALQAGVDGVAEGFGADAWLANWDVVGLDYDNLVVQGGVRARRVDTGGGLLYRAQGQPKGAAFGDTVIELDSLRDPRMNAQAASVFGKLTETQIADSVARVLRVPDSEIARVVDAWGPVDALERESLKARLIARKADLWQRFPEARPGASVPAPVADFGARVTAVEQRFIEESRLNGYSIRTDKDLVEDQDVLMSIVREPDGAAVTRGDLKLLARGDALLTQSIREATGGIKTLATASDLDDPIIELLKGINSRAAKGGALEAKTLERWAALEGKIDKAVADLSNVLAEQGDHMTPAAIKETAESWVYLRGWQTKLVAALRGKSATDAAVALEGVFERGKLKDITAAIEGQTGSVLWSERKGWSTPLTRTTNGNAVRLAEQQKVIGVDVSYHATVDGVRVTYIPFEGNSSGRSFQGTLHIEVAGSGADASARIFQALDQLGINAERADILDRQELYLNRTARINTIKSEAQIKKYAALDDLTDQAARVEAKIAHVSELVGRDITAADEWGTWEGEYQAFGHGRAHQLRADFDPDDFNAFAKEHVVYHNPTGLGTTADYDMKDRLKLIIDNGGQLSSLTDRVRRGISTQGATSATQDIRDGGGTGAFTRLRKVDPKDRYPTAGVYWHPRQAKRLDVIAYADDRYGDSTEATQRAHRKVSLEDWKSMAHKPRNEMVFKHSLSLFDSVEAIVMPNKADAAEMIAWMEAQGYKTWPDGRALDKVILPPP